MKIRMSKAGNTPFDFRQSGFSLIEMVAVLAIIALTSGLILSAISPGKSSRELKSVAIEIAAHLRNARSFAINRQKQNVVIFDVSRHIVNLGQSQKILHLDQDISMILNTADSEHQTARVAGIRFFPNGSSTGGTLQLRRHSQAYEIRVNWLNGRVELRRLGSLRSSRPTKRLYPA